MSVVFPEGDRTPAAPPADPRALRLRRAKLLASFAVAALVGIGSYTATYHVLSILSTPSATVSVGSVIPSSHTALTSTPARPLR